MPILGEIPRLYKGLHKPGGSGLPVRVKSGFLSGFSLFRQFVLAYEKSKKVLLALSQSLKHAHPRFLAYIFEARYNNS